MGDLDFSCPVIILLLHSLKESLFQKSGRKERRVGWGEVRAAVLIAEQKLAGRERGVQVSRYGCIPFLV